MFVLQIRWQGSFTPLIIRTEWHFLRKVRHGWALGFCSHTDFINSINVQLMFAGFLADGNGQFPCPSCRRLVTSPPDGFPVCAISEYISNNLSERSLGNKGKVEVYFLKYFITEHGVNISQKGSDQQPMVHGGCNVKTTHNVSNLSNHLRSCIWFKILCGMARHAVHTVFGALLFSQSFFLEWSLNRNEVEFDSLAEMATLHSNQIK